MVVKTNMTHPNCVHYHINVHPNALVLFVMTNVNNMFWRPFFWVRPIMVTKTFRSFNFHVVKLGDRKILVVNFWLSQCTTKKIQSSLRKFDQSIIVQSTIIRFPPLIQQLKKFQSLPKISKQCPKFTHQFFVTNMGYWKKIVAKSSKPNFLGITPNNLAIA
jgi:hypothetical protein